MSDTFDFVCIASHGSGIKAFRRYLTMLDGVRCLLYPASLEQVENFLEQEGKKGVILDSTSYLENGISEYILRNTTPGFLPIILSRDPVDRLLSVANTHLLWWAQSISGVFEKNVYKENIFPYSSMKHFIRHIINAKTMNAVVGFIDCIKEKYEEMLFVDVHDIYPENASKVLGIIEEKLNIAGGGGVTIPPGIVYAKGNSFVSRIKKLYINYNNLKFRIVPCPSLFCDAYGYENDIVITCNRDECGFTIGDNLIKEISFVCDDYGQCSKDDAKKILRSIFMNDESIIKKYCTDVSSRNRLANQIAENLYLSEEKIFALAADDKDFAGALFTYLEREIRSMERYCPRQLENWENTISFAASLRKHCRQGDIPPVSL